MHLGDGAIEIEHIGTARRLKSEGEIKETDWIDADSKERVAIGEGANIIPDVL